MNMNELSETTHSELVWIPTLDAAWPFDGRFHGTWSDDWASIARSAFRNAGFPRFRSQVYDRGDAFEVVTELPGIPKEQIHVTLQGTRLKIFAESAPTKATEPVEGAPRPTTVAVFERTLELPEPVSASSIVAKSENGVLTVTVPKPKPLPEERIAVA
jgi:HSP20 family protein